jgi:hypothetical protein
MEFLRSAQSWTEKQFRQVPCTKKSSGNFLSPSTVQASSLHQVQFRQIPCIKNSSGMFLAPPSIALAVPCTKCSSGTSEHVLGLPFLPNLQYIVSDEHVTTCPDHMSLVQDLSLTVEVEDVAAPQGSQVARTRSVSTQPHSSLKKSSHNFWPCSFYSYKTYENCQTA